MIFKIQKPLMTNGNDEPMALLYDRSRRVQKLIPWPMIEEFFQPGQLKVYIRGNINRKGQLLIDEIMPPQRF